MNSTIFSKSLLLIAWRWPIRKLQGLLTRGCSDGTNGNEGRFRLTLEIFFCEGQNTGKGCPEKPHHPWKDPRPSWEGLSGTWSSGRHPSQWQGLGTRWSLGSLPTPIILGLYKINFYVYYFYGVSCFSQGNKCDAERQNRNHSFVTLSEHKMQLRCLVWPSLCVKLC